MDRLPGRLSVELMTEIDSKDGPLTSATMAECQTTGSDTQCVTMRLIDQREPAYWAEGRFSLVPGKTLGRPRSLAAREVCGRRQVLANQKVFQRGINSVDSWPADFIYSGFWRLKK